MNCFYFGTFNPIHQGHLAIAQAAYNQLSQTMGLDRVVFVPTAIPPHRETDLLPARHRLKLVRLATADNPDFEVSDIEFQRSGPHFTAETLDALGCKAPVPFIIGSDSLQQLSAWHRAQDLVESLLFVQAIRPGYPPVHEVTVEGQRLALNTQILETPQLEISSTYIRQQLQAERSPRYLLPDTVLSYIRANRLFEGKQ